MKLWIRFLLIFFTITFPFFLIMTSIRVVLTPIFPEIEYRIPDFPDDPFGFTFTDRLTWSKVSIDYLVNDSGIDFLASRKLPSGTPLFNQRELSHMLDVKNLTQTALKIWLILSILYIALFFLAWKVKFLIGFYKSVINGGWLTIGLIILILIGVFVSFETLFTDFHRIFFTGDSWLFYTSDSLIRLFPERLWQDVFFAIGGISVLLSIGAIFLGRKMSKSLKHDNSF